MNAFVLLLALCFVDYSSALVPSKGGDESLPSEAAVPRTDATADSGSTASETAVPESVFETSPGSDVPPTTPVVASEPNTSVCPCRGSNRGVCHCLARGVTCRCSSNVGSEWEMAGNKPVNKTGRYLDPNQAVAVNRNAAPVSPAEGRLSDKPQPGFECKQYSDGRWYWNDGSGWRVTSVQPTDGQRFTGGGKSFVYRSGRMHDAPKMVAEIKPAPQRKGRWVCRGGYCEWVWQ